LFATLPEFGGRIVEIGKGGCVTAQKNTNKAMFKSIIDGSERTQRWDNFRFQNRKEHWCRSWRF
jgi:hypothetical protein